jgi:SpoVK/Ycf46/Vps4 family AAA+-type ATPase
MLCVSYVHGFHLSSKKWRKLFVNQISDIVWDNPFDNLVLPDNVKDLLLAFVRTKTSGDATFDDFVGGKGKGMIMLLSGAPGVGKTLTAEAIAEKLKVPVYTLSAGELGTDAEDVENKLLSAMKRCARWNAVLLLDECDIFLEKRELNSLERNELVSIFLRLVEYYEGIMLLTTNRINCIDPAFESRVDVAISYDNLSASARRQIWVNFITKMEQDGARIDKGLGDAALGKLAEHVLNGRQIKSIVKTGYLLARSKDQALNVSHLDAVLDLHSKRARQYE